MLSEPIELFRALSDERGTLGEPSLAEGFDAGTPGGSRRAPKQSDHVDAVVQADQRAPI